MQHKKLTPIKAIRKKCLECSGCPSEVKFCTSENCPLFCYRMGKRPKNTSQITKQVEKPIVLPIDFDKNKPSNEGQERLI